MCLTYIRKGHLQILCWREIIFIKSWVSAGMEYPKDPLEVHFILTDILPLDSIYLKHNIFV